MAETFGGLLREHRLAARLTQAELAYLADCDSSYLSRIELGHYEAGRRERRLSRRAVLALALVLELTVSQTDRLLFAAGLSPQTDYQMLWEREHGAVDDRTKWCPRCQEWLALGRFSRNRGRPDGLFSICKACESVRQATIRKRAALRRTA